MLGKSKGKGQPGAQKHNGTLAVAAKLEMRRRVLGLVTPAHVFDAFCGPDGEMWRTVWSQAASYVGVDEDYKQWDPRHRFVGDNRTIMRSVDLTRYNVFDLDAFGDPWQQLLILAARRPWAPGERGAVCITWNDLHTKWAGASHALAQIAGLQQRGGGPTKNGGGLGVKGEQALTPMAIRGFLARARVTPVQVWNAYGKSNLGKTGLNMSYWALVFEGAQAAQASA